MSKALWSARLLRPEIRLAQALSEFEASLSPGDKARLRSSKYQSQNTAPTVDDVMRLTAEVDDHAKKHLSSGRCFGPRFSSMLHAVQQFVALGDILIGGSQNLIACGVWSIVRITMLAATLSSSGMEKLSLLFMAAGRSAPRYQGLALLYARSRLIRDYLAEYMIIVVQICHYFHDFSRKSTIGQITSSLSESKIRNAEEELNRWAQQIKDEANLLLAQTTEHEATENRNIRNWLSRSMNSTSHQQQMDKRLQWLTAFSTFDYETPWKQARKRGSSSFFVDIPSYKQWKQRQGPPNLLLSGKMGCGKSVVMANMVDDLSISCTEDVVIYFFCRHDIPESLNASTIFGSFAAQILQRYIGTNTMDESLTNSTPTIMNLDKILEIIPAMIKRINGVRLILDGVDECPEQEFDLIRTGLLRLSAECSIISCVSYRDQADGLQAKIWRSGQGTIMSIPDDNPDIAEFIEAELQRLKESGKLSVGDPSLLITIREALLRGADGMFLWVTLQMDTICAEKTDHLIRRALENLPRSLSATFRRILEKSKQGGHCYQRDILRILVGAKRPLTVTEFREALSVSPGDISWDPRKMVNDIYSTLACCGSLVMMDEEEGTIRLLHQSVVQFLHDAGPDSMRWSFTAQDANFHLGQITITYLNYGIFDKRVSTRVVPQIYASGAVETIMTQALSQFGVIGRMFSDTVMKPQKPSNRNIGGTLFRIHSSEAAHEGFDFLIYSSENLMSHTGHMSHASSVTLQLFRRLLLVHPQYTSWLQNEHPLGVSAALDGSVTLEASSAPRAKSPHILYQSDMAPNISLQLQWAISHSHSLAFSMSLRDRLGLGALLSVIQCLIHLIKTGEQLKLESHMCDKLLLITTIFRCNEPTNWLITTHHYSLDRYLELLRESDWYGYRTFRWAVVRDCFRDLHDVAAPLLEEALAHKDFQTVKSLLRKGASPDNYKYEPPLQTAMHLSSSAPEYSLLVFQMLRTAQDLDVLECSPFIVDGFLNCLYRSVNPRILLSYACERGGQSLLESILAGEMEMGPSTCNELLCKALFGQFRRPTEIVSLLSMNWLFYNQSYEPAVWHAVHLRDWRSAFEISRFLVDSESETLLDSFMDARVSVSETRLDSFLDARDYDGLGFILDHAKLSHGKPRRPKDDGNNYRLFSPMASDWDSLQDCYELTKFSAFIQNRYRRLTYEDKDSWLVEGSNDLVLSLCQRILQYLSHEDPISEAHLLVNSMDLQASVLQYVNTLVEDFSGPSTSETGWINLTRMVLQRYRLIASHLATFRGHLSPKEMVLVDQFHVLRSNYMKILGTLLSKRHTAGNMQSDWAIMIKNCLEGWYPDAVMETTLRLRGFQETLVDLKNDRYRTFSANETIYRRSQLHRDHRIALSQLRTSNACLSELDSHPKLRIETALPDRISWPAKRDDLAPIHE